MKPLKHANSITVATVKETLHSTEFPHTMSLQALDGAESVTVKVQEIL